MKARRFLLGVLAATFATTLSSCSLPDLNSPITTGREPGLISVAPVAQATIFAPSPTSGETDVPSASPDSINNPDDHLGLSDTVVPYTEFGLGLREEFPGLIQRLDEAFITMEADPITPDSDLTTPIDIPLASPPTPPAETSLLGSLGTDPFLTPGPIDDGLNLPTGAVWHPELFVFGTLRSALQTFRTRERSVSEWANRLDLYANLSLTATERLLVGFRPLDREGDFTGYARDHQTGEDGSVNGFDASPSTLFFEGDLGQIFPGLSAGDRVNLDYQFSVGRQPLQFQDGIMLNDSIDAIGVTRHNLLLFGASAARLSAFWGWGDLHRGDNRLDGGARLYAVSSTLDYAEATLEIDAAYTDGDPSSGGDGAYLGLGRVGNLGLWNTTLRVNASWALQSEGGPGVGTGYLLSHEMSREFGGHHNRIYWNAWQGIDRYTSAARDTAAGGPLGRLGLLNRAVGLGHYGAPLDNQAGESFGSAIGVQHYFDTEGRSQVLFEIGGRTPREDDPEDQGEIATGAQYQYNFSPGTVFLVSGFGSLDENGDTGYGVRCEWLFKF